MNTRGGNVEELKLKVKENQKVCGCNCGASLPDDPKELTFCDGISCKKLATG
jgi:hypothetical protein